jgi:hypothetical protein
MLGEVRNSCRIFVRKSRIPNSGSKVIRGEKRLGWVDGRDGCDDAINQSKLIKTYQNRE